MGFPTSSTDSIALTVADTSTVINLNATGCADRILEALPAKIVVVDFVVGELEGGRQGGRPDADMLREMVASGLIEIVTLNNKGADHFERLVVGPAMSTLDDGEAATIAYAATNNAIAVIDERKATRICAEKFPEVQISCTVDIMAHVEVRRRLGDGPLADAVFNALQRGRMNVAMHHVKWVLELIGPERANVCTSLPKSVRYVQENLSRTDLPSVSKAV
jgi:predicted nucleic acid-binding protein